MVGGSQASFDPPFAGHHRWRHGCGRTLAFVTSSISGDFGGGRPRCRSCRSFELSLGTGSRCQDGENKSKGPPIWKAGPTTGLGLGHQPRHSFGTGADASSQSVGGRFVLARAMQLRSSLYSLAQTKNKPEYCHWRTSGGDPPACGSRGSVFPAWLGRIVAFFTGDALDPSSLLVPGFAA